MGWFVIALGGGLLAGWCGGVMAGLAGLGGGLIYTPFYIALFSMLAQSEGHSSAALAVSASLMAVAFTGMLSSRAHGRLGHVDAVQLVRLSPWLLLFAALGLWTTFRVPEALVLLLLACLDFYLAWDVRRYPVLLAGAAPSRWFMVPIGYISGLIGIGGGTMLMPLLRRSMPLARAVGTTAACGTVMVLGANIMHSLFHPAWRLMMAEEAWLLGGSWLGIVLAAQHGASWAAIDGDDLRFNHVVTNGNACQFGCILGL